LKGWIHHAATAGFAPIWLPISQNLPHIPKDEGLAKLFEGLHWAWSKITVASILLHVAAALKHHFIDKDATLNRTWFGKSHATNTQVHKSNCSACRRRRLSCSHRSRSIGWALHRQINSPTSGAGASFL
jgi:hypothetical protein